MAVLVSAAAVGLTVAFKNEIPRSLLVPLLAAVVVAAWYGGLGPGLLAIALGVLGAATFVFPTERSIVVGSDSWVALSVFVLLALLVTGLTVARKRAERLALEHSRWMETTLSSIGDGVVATTAEGAITTLNPVAERLTGWSQADARGRPLGEVFRIVSAVTRNPAENPVERVLRDGVVVGLANHTLLLARDGSERLIEDSAAPIRGPDGEIAGVILVFRDVSERSHTAQALLESRERMEFAMQAGRMGTWRYDVATGRVEWSENLEEIHGLPPGSFDGTYEAFVQLVHPEDRASLFAAVERALTTGSEYEHEFRIVRRNDGAEVWVLGKGRVVQDGDGKNVGMVGVGMDVTARHRSEEERSHLLTREREAREAAEEAERRSRFLSETALTLASSLEYERTLARVARLAVPEVADWCVIDLTDDESVLRRVAIAHSDPVKLEQAWEMERRHAATRSAPIDSDGLSGELRMFPERADGEVPPPARSPEHLDVLRSWDIRSAMSVPMVARGRILGAVHFGYAESGRRYGAADVALAEHVARRCALAVDNARLYREAQEANRAKDEFLATLSHELRTPLNAIVGWTYLLRQKTLGKGESETALEIIERNTRVQAQLIDDLLDVSRIVTGRLRLELAPLELAPVVSAAMDVVHPVAQVRGVRLEASLEPGLRVFGDPERLQQAVWNLLSNALKFTPRGGRVDVRLEHVDTLARLTVADTGRGISRSFLPHLFERFRQEDSTPARRHGGLGLGLAIVRHIVELHGGALAADSPGENRGSTFTIELPLDTADVRPEASGPAAPDLALANLPSLAGVRVLVVEDEADTRELLRVLLTRSGATVEAVISACAALAAVEEHPPDVLVSDLGLPGTDGYELVRRVKAFERRTQVRVPAIALTAYALDEDRQRALRVGFEAHVTKPVEPAELVRAIASLASTSR